MDLDMDNISSERRYTEDDLNCFENLQWEMTQLSEFLKDCNHRKITFFKFSLGVMSIFVSGFFALLNGIEKSLPFFGSLEFQIIIGVVLIVMCLLNYAIIKELFSIHSSRVHVIRQMNCLRQSMDAIRYKKHEGSYPKSISNLKDDSTKYWNAFGKHRKLQIDNEGLKESEKSWTRSPDMFMIMVLAFISIVLEFLSSLYLITNQEINKPISFISGVIVAALVVFLITDLKESRRSLKKNLGVS